MVELRAENNLERVEKSLRRSILSLSIPYDIECVRRSHEVTQRDVAINPRPPGYLAHAVVPPPILTIREPNDDFEFTVDSESRVVSVFSSIRSSFYPIVTLGRTFLCRPIWILWGLGVVAS